MFKITSKLSAISTLLPLLPKLLWKHEGTSSVLVCISTWNSFFSPPTCWKPFKVLHKWPILKKLDQEELCISSRTVIINFHRLGGLKQQKFTLSQFSRLEDQIQGVNRAGFIWRLWGRICSVLLSWHLMVVGNTWHPFTVAASFQSQPLSSHSFLLSPCFL